MKEQKSIIERIQRGLPYLVISLVSFFIIKEMYITDIGIINNKLKYSVIVLMFLCSISVMIALYFTHKQADQKI